LAAKEGTGGASSASKGGAGAGTKDVRQVQAFNDRMEDLKQYKETHGHANVTIREDRSLSKFCATTRYGVNIPARARGSN
jgi:hypothetical protein